MIDDIFVFDNVIHLCDMSLDNLREDRADAAYSRSHIVSVAQAPPELARRWSVEDMYDLVFVNSPTDMAMAQVVPIFDWFKDWFAPVYLQHAMAAAHPDRVLFCGGVDPNYRGLDDALEQLQYQVTELGACSMKFYNGHVQGSWRCDDERVAYPIYERCRDLGIKVLQFHKGVPFGLQNVEDLSPVDLQAAARDFPDLTFIIHHLALPYLDEAMSIASRFPNVYLALSGVIGGYLIAPRWEQEVMGRLLMHVGAEKLLWGSEAALAGSPAVHLRAFMELEIPEDLRRGYGYPQLTRDDKAKILGQNFARLMGIDVEAKKRELRLGQSVVRGAS